MTFDAAVAFSGDRTMFYLCEKVRCERKIAFLHFDFHHPRRDHAVYDEYFRRCDAVLSVSESCTSLLKREFPNLSNRFMTFYNVLPTRKIWILSMSGISLPPSNGEYRVLSVMRLCHQKGVDRIPIIIRMLTDRGVSVRWYIIGGGSERDIRRLRASAHRYCVSDRLILLGTVEEPYTMMRECDLFVLPSRFEGMPIVVEEAKLFAVPILCTDYLSAYEQLDNGRLGKIVAQTPSAIADGIASLLTSPVQMNRYRAELLSEPSKSRNVTLEWRKILDCE
jgi:glycosyltransferase involved in cell wall biosynthesis